MYQNLIFEWRWGFLIDSRGTRAWVVVESVLTQVPTSIQGGIISNTKVGDGHEQRQEFFGPGSGTERNPGDEVIMFF